MKELRCKKCNKLLGKVDGEYEIKCNRCKEMNTSSDECFYRNSSECNWICERCKHK